MRRPTLKTTILGFVIFCAVAGVVLTIWLFRLNSNIQERIANGWFLPPVEIYSGNLTLHRGEKLTQAQISRRLVEKRYRERAEGDTLREKDYAWLNHDQCKEAFGVIPDSEASDLVLCLYVRSDKQTFGPIRNSQMYLLGFDDTQTLVRIYRSEPEISGWKSQDIVELPPDLFAQFYDGEPILRKIVKIGEVPLQCSQAVTAIEDRAFLEHSGVSVTGLLRAFVANLFSRRYAQGGSTITQQLVKNYFLTSEKSMKRKVTEIFMAFLLEANVDKDQILENYMNVIYMGQNGPFQVRGFHAASDYYFSKDLSDLNLGECALLAAIVNNPGRYNPFRHPDHALLRRDLVLDRMVAAQMIDAPLAETTKQTRLPSEVKRTLSEPAPYFIQAVFRGLKDLGISYESGLRIFTTLDPQAQEIAQVAVAANVARVEKDNKKIAKLKEGKKNLEASMIVVDTRSSGVKALVGGRQYLKTQYNRVLDGHRQVGSVMKPFVYLAAFESGGPDDETYSPVSMLEDAPFTYKYEGQKWTPHNYTKDYAGTIPFFYALKNSLNVPTAKLGIAIGLDKIVDIAHRAGIVSEMKPFPSLTLGAFEIRPFELADAYSTIARFGSRQPIYTTSLVEDLSGNEIYKHELETKDVIDPKPVAELIGMMRQNLLTGTGRLASLRGFTRPAAGKTGTTSDTKDTWYVGFTPTVLTVTWMGYDDNTPTGLTGASGALPMWVDFMQQYTDKDPETDFAWPDDVEVKTYSADEIKELIPKPAEYELVDTQLVMPK